MAVYQRGPAPAASAASPSRRRADTGPLRPAAGRSGLLDLQAGIGNRATTRLVSMLAAAPPVPGAVLLQRCAGLPEPCGCHDQNDAAALQPRLRVGPAGDQYEQEAERMSAAVMASSPETAPLVGRALPGPAGQLQRSLDPGDEQAEAEPDPSAALASGLGPDVDGDADSAEESAHAAGGGGTDIAAGAEIEDGTPAELRLHPAPDGPRGAGPQVQRYVGALGHAGGRPLPDGPRRQLEPLFGRDFSNVRVHDDLAAAHAAQSVGALAFTVGRDVVFGAGQYAPGTRAGQALLAHELTHVVQQSGQPGGAPQAIQRARWGRCPSGPSLPANRPFRYLSAEFMMLAYFRAVGGSSCWSSNVEKFWEMSCSGPAGQRVRQFTRNFRSGKGTQNRRITADPRNVAAPPGTEPGADPGTDLAGALDAIVGSEAAVTAVAAFVQPDIIDFQHREIYDVTTAKQAARKARKVQGYVQLASRITGEHWTAGTRLQRNPMPPPFTFRPNERICFGPTDLTARPGVLAYEVIGTGKKRKKGKKESEHEQGKEKKKDEEPKTTAPPAANYGFGIGILSTGGGSGNVGLGISVMANGVSYGTVSAGVVYDSSGHAVGTVSAGAGAGNTSAAALSAGAGAVKDTTSAGALTAAAGTSSGSTSVGAVAAGTGSSEGDMTAGAAVAGRGTSKGNIAAGAGTVGSGHPEGNIAAVASTRGGGDVSGQIGATSGGSAGKTATTGPGSADGAPGGARSAPAGAHGLSIPGQSPANVDRAAEQAAEVERLLRQATPAQRAFFTALLQKTEGGPFIITGPEWMRLMVTATKDVSQEDLAYLITLNWQPGQVTAEQLRKQVQQALAHRAAGLPPGLPAEDTPERPVTVPVKHPPGTVTGKAERTTPPSETSFGDAPGERKRGGADTGSRGVGSRAEETETAKERAARIERLAQRARDSGPTAGGDVLRYSSSAKPGQEIDASVYLYGQAGGAGKAVWWTADVRGRLISDHGRGFLVTAGSELVSENGRVAPAGWWTRVNPLTFSRVTP